MMIFDELIFFNIYFFLCGFVQLELLGQSVYELVHPCDQEELRDILATRPGNKRFLGHRIFLLKYSCYAVTYCLLSIF